MTLHGDRALCRAFRLSRCIGCAALLLTAMWLLGSSNAQAADGPRIVRVEEDWELVVREPDTATTAPQVTCIISPTGDLGGVYGALTLNHKTIPNFASGGMQLQTWVGESPLSGNNYPHDDMLSNDNETVTWTQNMSLSGNSLAFEITNGHSTSWGNFGGQGFLKATVTTQLDDLNGYSADASKLNSGIGYASNRVTSLTLKRVRAFTQAGDVVEDSTPRVVYHHE